MKGTTRDQIIIKMLPFRICGILLHIVLCTHIRPRTLPIHDCSMQKQPLCHVLLLNGQNFGFLEKKSVKTKIALKQSEIRN